jgi:hypothetical protein
MREGSPAGVIYDIMTPREGSLSASATLREIGSSMTEKQIGTAVIEAAIEVHRRPGPGLLMKDGIVRAVNGLEEDRSTSRAEALRRGEDKT